MTRFMLAAAAAALLSLGSPAHATDLPPAVLKAPMASASASRPWTGWNGGISLGARWADITGTSLSFGGGPLPFPALAVQNYDSTAFRIGGYLGYDWQFAPSWLFGVEGDIAWGDAKKHVDALQGIAIANTGNFSEVRQTWDAGLRARLGYLLDPSFLLYVTGGVQWQHFTATENCAANTCGAGLLGGFPPGAPYLQTNATTRTGWTLGGGIEKMFSGKWMVRGEYRYADYGTWTTSFGGTPIIVKQFELATHTALLGIGKKF
jgi:outer membrane immunogenic protein